ncbi:AraC family transcriptional regulator [Flavivirga jejuensis]|uniref:AraC family transcriptional regulator n=1 Tax=Flavivirga jejuensis TaxID=870487 RepID=A0ABT8WJ38_9FLAO|nr:AraC family transcriptional regulator [Flavivirga jejuensis]MDO5972986.1 AraC family transcriptional regulator [Flavivirga jejuensis]
MKSNKTRKEYIKRVNYVLDFVEKNLDTDLSLERLSKKSNYSSFHFHRVFSIIVGETINEYINRKRVERIASILLVNTSTPIKELAYNYGFNSESSFSRTFKKYYRVSPTRFKSEGKTILRKIGIVPFTTEKYIRSIDNIKKWIDMNARITVKELEEIKLASIMHIGEFDKIGNMYQRLMKWGHTKKVLPTSDFKAITIYHDNPNVTQISKVRYSACVRVSKDINAEGEIRPFTIPKGNYAVGNFEIEANDISKAWESMSIWVIENNYNFRDGVYFEVYLNDHKTHPEQKFIIDICIPIEKFNKSNEVSNNENLSNCKNQTKQGQVHVDYHQLINYMKEIKMFFDKEYQTVFKLGAIYNGNPDFSYFSLTTEELKRLKLKFVIIFNHKKMCFNICLSGQNKSIRKKYWKLFKGSSWNKYHLAESIDDSLSIIDYTIVEEPNFDDTTILIKQIETESFKFINEIRNILE